jgi:predicted anti-sigma-YlaC factor YlaD
MKEVKQMVVNEHLDQPDISEKLFRDMGDQFNFEQSMHSFHTTPNTTIPNDQNGFAEFCYGNMISCKEGNMFACARNLSRYKNQ